VALGIEFGILRQKLDYINVVDSADWDRVASFYVALDNII